MFFDDPVAAHANLRAASAPVDASASPPGNPSKRTTGSSSPAPSSSPTDRCRTPIRDQGCSPEADPDQVEAVLTAAGWSDIRIDPITVEMRLGDDPVEATDYLADTGIARRVLDTIAPEVRPTALAEVTELLAQYDAGDGVRLGAGINLIHARA